MPKMMSLSHLKFVAKDLFGCPASLILCMLSNFQCFHCRLLMFFFKINCFKKLFRITIRVSNSLDPDQDRHFVGPDLGQKCFQRLSADNKSRH